MKGLNATALVLMLVLFGALIVVLYTTSNLIAHAPVLSTTTAESTIPYTTIPGNSSANSSYASSNQIIEYTLSVINSERAQFGLQNVTLSNTTSGQQHSDSMLYYNYFSHWDPFGMKPYMRYTLLGGSQGIDENVAYNEQVNESCLATLCDIKQINVTAAISHMNYQMLYNDSACCGNGHRNNTLDPNHNEVSIGVSYNKTSVYLVEDFINNYIMWLNKTPGIAPSGGMIHLNGLTLHNSAFSSVQITYDSTPQNMSNEALAQTKAYGQGPVVAAVAFGSYYYQNVQTVYASTYKVKGNSFNIAFNLSSVVAKNGAGVYTINLYLTNSTGATIVGSTYSVFVNSAGQPYLPRNV